MQLHNTLPFSSVDFFQFMGTCFAMVLLLKFTIGEKLNYKWVLLLINCLFIGLFFTKPLQLIGLILYLYIALLALRKWYKSDSIIFPILVLAAPIFCMKTAVLFPLENASTTLRDFKNIVQIAGLSYIVFKVIGLYIDERRNSEKISFLSFFNFTAFVPTLLIGPIDRFGRFNKDVEQGFKQINASFYTKGWNNLLMGLLFKYILAEVIHRLLLSQFIDDGSIFYHASYMYTYLLYLFFDFAGYSFLAISFGNFLGIDVPINFDKPFSAVNPKEFWKKWHKSLGDWLGDYFFKPIFKYFSSKKVFSTSIRRQNVALFLTFTLMGFWNGFELHYIVSGMLFGLYSVVHNFYIYRCKKEKRDVFFGNMSDKMVRIVSIFFMFNLTAFAIYIFSGNLI